MTISLLAFPVYVFIMRYSNLISNFGKNAPKSTWLWNEYFCIKFVLIFDALNGGQMRNHISICLDLAKICINGFVILSRETRAELAQSKYENDRYC